MEKKKKSLTPSLHGFEKSKPRKFVPQKSNEGEARLYTNRGRLILSGVLLKHFGIKPQHYELFFDKKRKLVAIKLFKSETSDTFIASTAKGGACMIELRGPFRREKLEIELKEKPVVVKIEMDPKELVLYFSYESFAKAKDIT